MLDCIKAIKKTKPFNKKKGLKDPRFDVTKVTNDMVFNIFNGSTEDINKFTKIVDNKTTMTKFKFSDVQENNILMTGLDKNSDTDKATFIKRAIAVKNILSAIKSNKDIANNLNLLEKQKELLEENGLIKPSMLNMEHIIGRQILEANNILIDPQAYPTQKELVNAYALVGKNAIDELADSGLGIISVNEKGMVVNNDFRKNNNTNLSYSSHPIIEGSNVQLHLEKLGVQIDKNGNYPESVLDYLYKNPVEDSSFTNLLNSIKYPKLVTMVDTTRYVGIMKLQSNLKLPDTEAEDTGYITQHSIGINNFLKSATQLLNKNSITVKPELGKLFSSLETDMQNKSFWSWMKEQSLNPKVKLRLFGMSESPILDEQESNAGKSRSRIQPLIDLISSFSALKDKSLHYHYAVARNNRLHMEETVGNFQADKHLSRWVMTSGEYSFKVTDKDVYEHFMRHLVDESGLSQEAILNNGVHKQLDYAVNAYTDVFKTNSNTDQQKNLLINLAKDGIILSNGSDLVNDSVWQTLSILEGIRAVREAKKSGIITTTFDTMPDASVSGGMNLLAQGVGKYPKVTALLKDLNILHDDNGKFSGTLKDLYAVTKTGLDSFRNKINETKNPMLLNSDKVKALQVLDDFITMNKMKERDLHKDPTMTFIYRQSRDGNIKTNSKLLAKTFLKGLTPDQFKYMSDTLFSNNTEMQNLLKKYNEHTVFKIPGIVEILAKAFEPSSALMFDTLTDSLANTVLKEQNEFTEKAYKLLVEIAGKDVGKIRILPPLALLNMSKKDMEDFHKTKDASKLLNQYGAPLTKLVETLTTDMTLLKKEVANNPSPFVIPQHLIDTAILVRAYMNTMKYFKNRSDTPLGVMPVHDHMGGSAVFNTIFEKEYQKEYRDVALNYDFMEMMMLSIESAAKGKALSDAQQQEFNKLKKLTQDENGKPLSDKKKAVLESLSDEEVYNSRVFGAPPLEQYIELESDKTKESGNTKSETISNMSIEEYIDKIDIKNSVKKLPTDLSDKYTKMLSEIKQFMKKDNVIKYITTNALSFYNKDVSDNESIQVNISNPQLQVISELHHEITHAKTYGYILNKANTPAVKYLEKSYPILVSKLQDIYSKNKDKNLTPLLYRINYISRTFNTKGTSAGIAEIVAILNSEPEIARKLYKALSPSMSTRVRNILKRISKAIKNLIITQEDVDNINNDNFSIDKVFKSVDTIVKENILSRETTKAAVKLGVQDLKQYDVKAFDEVLNYDVYTGNPGNYSDPISNAMARANMATSVIIANILLKPQKGQNFYTIGEDTHKLLKDTFPAYKHMAGYLNETYESNELLQQMSQWINLTPNLREKQKNQAITIAKHAMENSISLTNENTYNLSKMIMHYVDNDVERATRFNRIWATTPIYHLLNSGQLSKIVDATSTLEDEIAIEEKILNDTEPTYIKKAENLASLLIDGEVKDIETDYNTDNSGKSKAVIEAYKRLVALYSLNRIEGAENTLVMLNQRYRNLYDELVTWSVALYNLSEKIYEYGGINNKDQRLYRENRVSDIFEIPKTFKLITKNEINQNIYSQEHGWKILVEPGNSIGVIYRDAGDKTRQEGTGTTINYASTDLVVPESMEKFINEKSDNVIATQIGNKVRYRYILKHSDKVKIGLRENAADSLVRSVARLAQIQDTQVLRTEFAKSAFTYQILTDTDKEDLVSIIKDKEQDNPWFINYNSNKIDYNKLPKEIRQKYKIIETNISSVSGFRSKVKLVRKDSAHWLMGYDEPVPFENNPTLRKVASIVRKLVVLMKLHWVVVNPRKIKNDLISNSTILITNNVPIQKIAMYGKEAATELKNLEELRNIVLQAKIDYLGNPSDTEAKELYNQAKTNLKAHPLGFALQTGMIQSLSTDIVLKNYHTISGLQKDIEVLLAKFMRKEDGNMNVVADAIMKFSKAGPRFERLLNLLGNAAPEDMPRIRDLFNNAAERIKSIKDDNEIEKYLSEFIGSPDSELVRLGSAATQYADIIPRIILYKHFKDMGKSEEEAVKDSLEAFIDYKVNMPKELKVLSDYGILLFPSFWMRIQLVIAKMTKNNASSLGLAVIFGELFGEVTNMDLPHIIDSNIFNRFYEDNLLNIPAPTWDMLLPTKALNF